MHQYSDVDRRVNHEWMQRGIEQGARQGFAPPGQATALIGILEERFGPVDDAVRQRIASLDAESFSPLIRRAVTVTFIDTLFRRRHRTASTSGRF